MPAYMLDTDIASYVMKRSNESVLDRLAKIPVSDVCISAITYSELQYGVSISPERQSDHAALEMFLKHVQVLDYPQEAALHYGEIRADLKSSGLPIGPNDLLIAAHARSVAIILVSNNMRELRRIPSLQLEKWAI